MTTTELEKRLTAIEQELARIRLERNVKRHPAEALEKIHATFENDEAFKEAMRLGKKWRESQRPRPSRAAKAKRK